MNYAYTQENLGDLLFSNGYIGVDLFFMISGFVIMLSTMKDNSSISFLIKRLFRIYQTYITSLLFIVYIFNKPYDFNFIKALLFINEDITSRAPWFGYTIVFTAWTLMFEMIFYIYFAVSILISRKHRGIICSLLLVGTVISINFLSGKGLVISGYDAIPINKESSSFMYLARVLSSPMFFEFIADVFIFCVYKNIDKKIYRDITKYYNAFFYNIIYVFLCDWLQWWAWVI